MLITRKSPFTGQVTSLEVPVTTAQLAAWQAGEPIQLAMTNVPAELREFIMTGITPQEWNSLFGDDPDDLDDDDDDDWDIG